MITADGTVRWTHLDVTATDSDANAGSLVTLSDITDRRRAEETDERLRVSFERGAVPQALMSVDGAFLRVNDALARMLGYSVAELTGRRFGDVTHPDDLSASAVALRAALVGAEPVRFEKRYITRGGATVWASVNVGPVRDSSGRVLYLPATIIDITEQKLAEDALRESEARFAATFELMPMALGITTIGDGRFLAVNKTFEAVYGYSSGDVKGRTSVELGIWANPEDRSRALSRVKEEGGVHDFETTIRRKDGTLRWVSFHGDVVNLHGVPTLLCAALDITERRRADEALRDVDRRKNEFLAMLAHELRNPLAAISNAQHVLDRSETDDPKVLKMRSIIGRQARQLSRLVDDLLDVARITHGKIRSSSEWVPGQRRLRNWPLLRCLGGCDAAVTMNLALSSNSGLAATVFFPNDRPWHGRCFRNA